MSLVVIGVGNPYRRDDAAGIEVARRLRLLEPSGTTVLEHEGEPAGLLQVWAGAGVVYLIDAVRGDCPGRVHRFEIGPGSATVVSPPPFAPSPRESSHALGLGEAIELARALGRLPERLVLFAIEGADFAVGEGLGDAVDQAATAVAAALLVELDSSPSGAASAGGPPGQGTNSLPEMSESSSDRHD